MKQIFDFIFNLFFDKPFFTWSLSIEYAIGKNLITDPICICSTSKTRTRFRYEFKNSCILKNVVYTEEDNREIKHIVIYDSSYFAEKEIYIKRGDVLEFEFNPYDLTIHNSLVGEVSNVAR